jgi:MtrB/PioB family decaheme-associated outer membrane protein
LKTRIIIFILVLNLLSFRQAFSDDYEIKGDVTVTGILDDVDGNEAKFNEYSDVKDGFYGKAHLEYDSEKYFLDINAEDIGYKTQRYGLEGGKWGSFSLNLYYQQIPQNINFDAMSFYSGIGSDRLTGTPNTNVNTWSNFDYSTERKNYGVGFKLDMIRPFYLNVSLSREDKSGIRPTGAEGGATSFGNTVQLPEPVDYSTDTLKVEAGYARKPFFGALSLFLSDFDNYNKTLDFTNPFVSGNPSDTLTLPPDNEYYKVAFKGGARLPLNSKFDMNLGYSRTRSDSDLLNTYIGSGSLQNISLSDSIFHGRIDTHNYAFSLTSNPLSFLDSKIFYKYYSRNNKSDEITTTDGPETFINNLISYRKNHYGMEFGFRLTAGLCLTTAYTHVMTNRTRDDIPENKDDIYSIDLRWDELEFMSLSIGYEKMHRNADFHAPEVDSSDPDFIETFVRRFDASAQDRDTYKASVDIYPLENLNFSMGFKDKNTRYKSGILGLKSDKRYEFNVDGNYTIKDIVKFTAYYDYERIRYDQFQRALAFNATTGFDPSTPPTPSNYNWDLKQTGESYDYGVGADIYLIRNKLTLRLQHDYIKANGTADFTYLLGTNPLPGDLTQENIDISNWDDYRLETYILKAIYYATKSLFLSAEYAYESYRYNDALLDGYQFTLGDPTNTYLTGAYKDQSFKANIIFVTVSYNF